MQDRTVRQNSVTVVVKTYRYEPKWPSRCVVCGQACDGRRIVVCPQYNSVLPIGPTFVVPLHEMPKKCASDYMRRYYWLHYGAWLPLLAILGLFVSAVVIWQPSGAVFLVGLISALVGFLACGAWIESTQIVLRISESEDSDGRLGHAFRFTNAGYAEEFRHLNSDHIAYVI